MPSLGADMDEGTLTRWLVRPGDRVAKGDIVAVIDTEKSTIEVEIFESGTVEQLVVPEGTRVPVGTVLARVGAAPAPAVDGAAAAPEAPSPPGPAAAPPPGPAAAPTQPDGQGPPVHSPVVRRLAAHYGVDLHALTGSGPGGSVTRGDVERAAAARTTGLGADGSRLPSGAGPTAGAVRLRSSPLARRRAAELGVDLRGIQGSGPGGAVLARDVVGRRHPGPSTAPAPAAPPLASAAPPVPPAGPVAPARAPAAAGDRQASLRRAVGALMARSKREIPHFYLATTIDLGAASSWLERTNAERPVPQRLVASALLLAAAARAVARTPELNGFFVDGAFRPGSGVHLGVAVSLRSGGVVAPAIHDADRLDPDQMMAALHDLVGRARSGTLRSSEMSDPTVTVTNLGDLGVDSVFGVIYPPQVALIGFGRVAERAVVRAGEVVAAPCVTASLAADHRVSDGHRAGRLLADIDRFLQRPEDL